MVMDRLRKYAKLYLWIVVIGFIGWIFFDLGANLVGKRVAKPWQRGIIAEVNKHPIPERMFEQLYSLAYQDSVRAKGRELTDQESYALENEIWKTLIKEYMWSELNKRRHLELDDNTVLQIIKSSPPREILSDTSFRNDQGQFDYQKYIRVLQDPRNLPFFERYEKLLRQQVPKDITRYDVLFSIPVSKADVWYEYRLKYEKVKVKGVGLYIRNVPESLVTVTDEELKKFYDENIDSFRVPAQAAIEYVTFRKSPSKEDTLDALERARAAIDEIKEGTPFEEAVMYYSEDESKSDSGDLGWIKRRGKWAPLYEKAKDLKKGEISDPFLTPYGWNIVKMVEKAKDSLHVKLILVRIRTSGATRAEVRERANSFYERAKEIGLEKAAKEYNLKVQKSGLFNLNRRFIPLLGADENILKFVKRGSVGDLSPLMRQSWRYLIIKIVDKKPSHVLSFEEAKDKCKRMLSTRKAHGIIKEAVLKILERVRNGDSLEVAVKEFDYLKPKLFQSDWISRFDAIPKIGYVPEVIGAAFTMPRGKFSDPIETRMACYTLKVLDKQIPSQDEIKNQLVDYMERIRNFWADKVWKEWTEELFKKANVKDYRSYILN